MRTWFLGRETWAYPWMKWLGIPMFRVGAVLCGGSILISGHSSAVTGVGAGLLVASGFADLANYLTLRARRQKQTSA
jgi:hypothetical protein